MRIKRVTEEAIIFDNGMIITYDHANDCCEWNYADFSILTPNTVNFDYDFDEIQFKAINGMGFMFGCEGHWIFIPCYSEQNGWYSSDINIYFCGKCVLNFNCEEKFC